MKITVYERDVARMQSFQDIPEEQMKSIQTPAMILSGDKDVVTPEHAVEMQCLLPGSRLVVLPGGHGNYIGELNAPKDSSFIHATVLIINDFLNEPSTGRK